MITRAEIEAHVKARIEAAAPKPRGKAGGKPRGARVPPPLAAFVAGEDWAALLAPCPGRWNRLGPTTKKGEGYFRRLEDALTPAVDDARGGVMWEEVVRRYWPTIAAIGKDAGALYVQERAYHVPNAWVEWIEVRGLEGEEAAQIGDLLHLAWTWLAPSYRRCATCGDGLPEGSLRTRRFCSDACAMVAARRRSAEESRGVVSNGRVG